MIKYNEGFKLEKSVWTTEDFEIMGWHDCEIHGISFEHDDFKIILDIDYIYTWVEPAPHTSFYSFWVSPCTLVFENAYEIDIQTMFGLTIDNIVRSNERIPTNAEFINKTQEWEWAIECHQGGISFMSVGYTQYTRMKPQHIKGQSFSKQERGGVKFDIIENIE